MTNRIIEVPDISVVKTVDGVKQLFSLRNRKVKKGTLRDFASGSGVMRGGDLYVLDPGIIGIVKLTTTRIDPSFGVAKVGDIEVDWGDGTRDTNVFSHVYTDGVVGHDVVFYGRNRSLVALLCPDNQITALDVTANKALLSLDCRLNQIYDLDITQNQALQMLECSSNRIAALDISNNVALTYLSCSYNRIAVLDVAGHAPLTYLDCDSNRLTALDVSSLVGLTRLSCCCNWIVTLDLGSCAGLAYLACGSNGLDALNVGGNPLLGYVACASNPFLKDCAKLITLVNSLPNRPANDAGLLDAGTVAIRPVIEPVCRSKNWEIS